jgi:hypothetical protein
LGWRRRLAAEIAVDHLDPGLVVTERTMTGGQPRGLV